MKAFRILLKTNRLALVRHSGFMAYLSIRRWPFPPPGLVFKQPASSKRPVGSRPFPPALITNTRGPGCFGRSDTKACLPLRFPVAVLVCSSNRRILFLMANGSWKRRENARTGRLQFDRHAMDAAMYDSGEEAQKP